MYNFVRSHKLITPMKLTPRSKLQVLCTSECPLHVHYDHHKFPSQATVLCPGYIISSCLYALCKWYQTVCTFIYLSSLFSLNSCHSEI